MNERAPKKIVIDAGHGGNDPGTSGNGIVEKEYNLLISNYIYERLKELGLNVSRTRPADETLTPSQRVNKAKNFYGSGNDVLLISNHINAGGGEGAEVIYALRNNSTLSRMIASELEKAGQTVRKYYQRRLPSDPAQDYYFILRDTANNESIIVEYGFADNASDAADIKNNWRKYAEAVVSAVAQYLGVNYVPSTDANVHVVKSGDTLWNLAKKYNTSVNELKKLNNLNSNSLSIGQVLYLPTEETSVTEGEDITYTVKSGDTLYKIAANYNTTVDNLKKLNNLTSNNLSIGQVLYISKSPQQDDSTNQYIVKSGDNLYSISKLYGVSVNELKQANGLTSNLLTVGQVLKIPTGKESDLETYTVKSGDTLYNIARIYDTSVSNLIDINNLSTSTLSIGQKLLVPKK